ncbi:adenylate isopentenyltransferase-like [Pistacia vera]|uniref:adenylate isopentenyltransferase-like n=1 Tax=Pistacia vera TaxID=55513 RepID=UPI001263C229|nr:adenylate isopentenyltransferase-like [Pistacia vera]
MRLSYHDIHFMLFQTSTLTLMVMASSTTTKPITTPPTFQPHRHHRKKGKIIVIMGASGTGNSSLSIDLDTGYFPSEIKNSEKMQVYKSLVLTTNKIYLHERQNIIHHLLGEFDWQDGELTPVEFCHLAYLTVFDINSCKITPFIAGGFNSFIYALLVKEEHKRYPAQNSVSAAQQILLPSGLSFSLLGN